MKDRVLFVCVHNSARSQMAEAYLRSLGGETFEVESAGFEPKEINPYVVEVMKEEGIDLTNKKSQNVFDLYKAGRAYKYVITVCKRGKESDCPIFPGVAFRLHWDLENPEDYTGAHEEIVTRVRLLRDEIKALVQKFMEEAG